ncbi:unnamed protein product [Ixodes pacificus]
MLAAGRLRKVQRPKLQDARRCLEFWALPLYRVEQGDGTTHGEQDCLQPFLRHYRYFHQGWTTRTRGSGASRSSADQLDTLDVASCVGVLSGSSPSARTARDCPKMKWAFNSFSWCCKPASTTCGPSARMKSRKHGLSNFQHYVGKKMANSRLIPGRVIASAATTDNEQAATSKKEQSGSLT